MKFLSSKKKKKRHRSSLSVKKLLFRGKENISWTTSDTLRNMLVKNKDTKRMRCDKIPRT